MTTPRDRDRLRKVAVEYAEMVNSDVMNERRELWRRSTTLEERTVPFQVEDNGSFFADLTPEPGCEGDFERGLEHRMLRALANHRLIPDDRVFPSVCEVGWAVGRTSVCPELELARAADATGRELGYKTNKPLADLATGLAKLRPTEFSVDREGTERRAEQADALIGDLLPVEVTGHSITHAATGYGGQAVHLMGMDSFYMGMIDQPERVHEFMTFLADDNGRFATWLEEEGLITLNNRELDVGSGSCGYTDELPRRELTDGGPVLMEDCWAYIEAQEAVGISPEMYAEFLFPYQRRLGDRYGLVYYGCCEPVHGFWDSLRDFRTLRKVTVSPWCDQRSIAASVGREVILSRKPHPMQLCGPTFSPEEFGAHIQETLDIAADCFLELIFRDTCTLSGSMKDRVVEACGIVKRLLGREY